MQESTRATSSESPRRATISIRVSTSHPHERAGVDLARILPASIRTPSRSSPCPGPPERPPAPPLTSASDELLRSVSIQFSPAVRFVTFYFLCVAYYVTNTIAAQWLAAPSHPQDIPSSIPTRAERDFNFLDRKSVV